MKRGHLRNARAGTKTVGTSAVLGCSLALALATDAPTNSLTSPELIKTAEPAEQAWNWHVQNTDIIQYHPGFAAAYSGPNSMDNGSEVAETISLDLTAGVRLWRGAEAHADLLMWQGYGLSKTLGIEGFPNGEAFRLGTSVPNVNLVRLFIHQTIGLGGELEKVEEK